MNLSKSFIAISIASLTCLNSCLVATSAPERLTTATSLSESKTEVVKEPMKSNFSVPRSVMSFNFSNNGKSRIYTFEVNSNRVAGIRLPNGKNRVFPKGSEPLYKYGVTSQAAKTAKLIIVEKEGSDIVTRVAFLTFGAAPSEGKAKVVTSIQGKSKKTESGTFFLNSPEFYR